VSLHAILVPYYLGKARVANGLGPEALVASGALERLNIHTTSTIEVELNASSEIQQCIAIDAALSSAITDLGQGAVPIVFSGNCHACLGTLSGTQSASDIIWFDAHGDLNTPDTSVTGYFDGMALATALGWSWTELTKMIPEFTPRAESDVLLVGARDLDPQEHDRLMRSRIRHYAPPALSAADSDPQFAAAIPPSSSNREVYVHLDLDVLDPSELPVNRFTVPGGVSIAWLEQALRAVRERRTVAAVGVSAYNPAYSDPSLAAPIVNRLLKALLD
jgi:arginase